MMAAEKKSKADLNRMSVKGFKAVMNILDKWGLLTRAGIVIAIVSPCV